MSAINQLGLAQIGADVAGSTGSSAAPQPAHPTLAEVTHVTGFDFGSMLAGGFHPDAVHLPTELLQPLEKASDSLRGPNGGLIPRTQGILAPGPAGGAAGVVAQATTQVKSTFQKIRERFAGQVPGG